MSANFQKFLKTCPFDARLLPDERGDACLSFGSIFAAIEAISQKIRMRTVKKVRIGR